ncbi:MAG: hypothetical protein QOJ64_3152 [Acidobacteriota bacterium]|jgi:uncharacterized protein YdeI (YjbR/CyaY-like superfamily)|nr:hypothetical protein [Acidobacteriota bacterium]
MGPEMELKFFRSPSAFRKWLEKHHATADELWVGFYKKASGKASITWPESVDDALCFGWIDGIRKRVDDLSYTIRFTPRRQGSIWSTVNIKRAGELIEEGLMQAAGMKAFEARQANKSGIYAYEQRSEELVEPYASKFKGNKAAWKFFNHQPPGYRKLANWWIVSAKKEETRLRRLQKLIDDSAQARRLGELSGTKTSK